MHTYRISLELRTCIASSFIRWACRWLCVQIGLHKWEGWLQYIYVLWSLCEMRAAEYWDIFAVDFVVIIFAVFFFPLLVVVIEWVNGMPHVSMLLKSRLWKQDNFFSLNFLSTPRWYFENVLWIFEGTNLSLMRKKYWNFKGVNKKRSTFILRSIITVAF